MRKHQRLNAAQLADSLYGLVSVFTASFFIENGKVYLYDHSICSKGSVDYCFPIGNRKWKFEKISCFDAMGKFIQDMFGHRKDGSYFMEFYPYDGSMTFNFSKLH